MIISLNDKRIDIKHRTAILLQNLYELGGKANTRDIARRSGLKGWEVREAAKQACDHALIVDRGYDPASYGPGSDPKLYELNGTGRQVVERGIPGKVIALQSTDAQTPEKEFQDLKKAIARLERKVSQSQNDEFEQRFNDVRERLNAKTGLDEDDLETLRDDLEDLEAYVVEWNEAVEMYLFALREVVERELSVDLDKEIEIISAD